MLLSRTAEQLYWLGRHLERAEGMARIVLEHTSVLVDLPVDVDSDWSALLSITGAHDPFTQRFEDVDEAAVVRFLLADRANPGSFIRTLEGARENLRVSRTVVPTQLWNSCNQLHMDAVRVVDHSTLRAHRLDLCERAIAVLQRIDGVVSGTMSEGNAKCFITLGRLVERADLAVRVLDVRATSLLTQMRRDTPAADRSPYEDVRWLGVLRSVGAQEMFRRASTVTVDGVRVTDFVLDDPAFPRSVRSCLDRIGTLLDMLPAASAPVAMHRIVTSHLDQRGTPESPVAFHLFLEDLQQGLSSLHGAVTDAWFRTLADARPSAA